MITSLSPTELCEYVGRQLDNLYPDGNATAAEVGRALRGALARCERCFTAQNRVGFPGGAATRFDHLNTDRYAVFLYYLGNEIHRTGGDPRVAAKTYALNKALHGLDLYYEVEMPEVFAVQHPVGTVLGRASYGNCFFVYQGCVVGVGVDGKAPTLGDGTVLFGGSSVLGGCTLGDNTWVSAGSVLLDATVPANSVVFGRSPDLTIRPTARSVKREAFGMSDGAASP
jgi:serine O-acetyltransferase